MKSRMFSQGLPALFLFFFSSAAHGTIRMSLKDFMDQYKKSDPASLAAQKALLGGQKILRQAEALTAMNIVASGSYLSDGRPTVNASFQGDQTVYQVASIGLQQQTLYGISWTLTQNFSHTRIRNASLIPTPEYHDAFPKLEFVLPLNRNWMGSEMLLVQRQLQSQLELQAANADLKNIQKEIEARETFFNLALQQRQCEILADSLQRAQRLLGWAESRQKRNLMDKGDVYQVQAMVATRQMELLGANFKLKESIRKFNALLGLAGREEMPLLHLDELESIDFEPPVHKVRSRYDYVVQKKNIESSEYGYELQREKAKSYLNLSVAFSRQGRDPSFGEAQSKIFSDQKDYFFVGLSFSSPFDSTVSSEAKEGYRLLAESEMLSEMERKRNEALDWQNAIEQAKSLFAQYGIMKKLEETQKRKSDLEREKYNNGRSTTFQVLGFEQDYLNARNQKNNLELQIRKFLNSLNLYKAGVVE